jgi:hypothetical protein
MWPAPPRTSCCSACGASLPSSKPRDPFVEIFSFALTLAYMIAIAGRNFASNLLVLAQIVCAGVPMMAALLMVGGWYYAVLPLCLYHLAMTLEGVESREQLALIGASAASPRCRASTSGRAAGGANSRLCCCRRCRKWPGSPEARARAPARTFMRPAAERPGRWQGCSRAGGRGSLSLMPGEISA